MFLFFHSKQDSTNKHYYKGILFEGLIKTLLEELRYKVKIRQKKSSLEYDIEGRKTLTNEILIAEAKAVESTIPAKELTSFAGKLLPLWLDGKKINGLFLSISPLSAEGEDYFESIKKVELEHYTGSKLHNLITEELHLPKVETLQKALPEGMSRAVAYTLVTDTGIFKVLTCRSSGAAIANSFLTFDDKGTVVSEINFLEKIKSEIVELHDLQILCEQKVITSIMPASIFTSSALPFENAPTSKARRTFADVYEDYIAIREKEYLAGLEDREISARTRGKKTLTYQSFQEIKRLMTRDFLPLFSSKFLEEVDELAFESFCESKEGDMSNHRKVLGGFLRWCKKMQYIKYVPELTIPVWYRRKRPTLTSEEMQKLLNFSKNSCPDFMFITLGLAHNLAPNERTNLRWSDIDFENDIISYRRDKCKTLQKKKVALNQDCKPLYKIFSETSGSPWVFPHEYDTERPATRGWYQFRWRKLLRSAGLVENDRVTLKDITPNDLNFTRKNLGNTKVDQVISDCLN